jgi:FkbM family methyltransferase
MVESNRSFLSDFAMVLAEVAGGDHRDNHDWRRFGPSPDGERSAPTATPPRPSWRARIAERIAGDASPATAAPPSVSLDSAKFALRWGMQFVSPHAADLEWLYRRLEDEESRDLLARLFAFRALGNRIVKLPTNRPELWRAIEQIERSAEGRETTAVTFANWRLPKLDLREFGYPIDLFCSPVGAEMLFLSQQYRCCTADGAIEVRDGDVVIDAGGCWGDSALYFAFRAGQRGKVFSFEFLPENVALHDRNRGLNPELAARIELVPSPVWSSSGVELFVSQNGPGTTVTPDRKAEGDAVVRTLKIDDLMQRPGFTRIDFIKMDIEGAELEALRGAERVIREFRPRLAITVYHSPADFWQIPQFIDSLGLGYRFYLRHFTIHAEETVLYAEC